MGSNPTYSASLIMLAPTPEEEAHRTGVLRAILGCIATGETIRLPEWDRAVTVPKADFALLNVGLEPNRFGGHVGAYRYQFEGEDDLLHLLVCRIDQESLSPDEGREVALWLLQGVPPGLYWVKAASRSLHLYVGHDILPDSLIV